MRDREMSTRSSSTRTRRRAESGSEGSGVEGAGELFGTDEMPVGKGVHQGLLDADDLVVADGSHVKAFERDRYSALTSAWALG